MPRVCFHLPHCCCGICLSTLDPRRVDVVLGRVQLPTVLRSHGRWRPDDEEANINTRASLPSEGWAAALWSSRMAKGGLADHEGRNIHHVGAAALYAFVSAGARECAQRAE